MDLFGTAGVRGPIGDPVTPELAAAIGLAAGRDGSEFVVGCDGRETSEALADAVCAGLASAGAAVNWVGRVPTPALAYATRDSHGIMVTASHNPPTDNGFKLFDGGREYGTTAERRIERRVADAEPPVPWDAWGRRTRTSVLPAYRTAVTDYASRFGESIDGSRIVVDCGNGMGAMATPQVLRRLGADVVALNDAVDGHFPGRNPKPTRESLGVIRSFLGDGNYAFGLAHDGDADRIVVVDADGSIVHEDTVLAILAGHYVRDSHVADPVVVTTPNASSRIDEHVESAGGRTERCALGALHEGVARVTQGSTDETEVVFAAEPWKHMHTRFGPWIDGVVSAAVLARLIDDVGLDSLRDPVAERPALKADVPCPDGRKAAAMATLETALPEAYPGATVDTAEGVRLNWNGEWLLVRASGTEPYLRLYAEHGAVTDLIEQATEIVEHAVETAA